MVWEWVLVTANKISSDSIIYEFKMNSNNFDKLCSGRLRRWLKGVSGDADVTSVGDHVKNLIKLFQKNSSVKQFINLYCIVKYFKFKHV